MSDRLRGISYALHSLTGVLAFFLPSLAMVRVAGHLTWAFGAVMLIGGALAAVGQFRKCLMCIYVGLPLMMTGMLVYAYIGTQVGNWTPSLIMLAVLTGLAATYVQIRKEFIEFHKEVKA